MINFGSFSDNHPSQSTIDSSTIVSRRSNIKLDFDEETPRNGTHPGPSRHMTNIFLRKERKNLSDSTPSRSQMQPMNAQFSSNFQDLFMKSQNDCAGDSEVLKGTGTFLPRLGSSESLETDKISIQDELSEVHSQTLSELQDEQLLADIPLIGSIQRYPHRSFTECIARTKLSTKPKQKSVAEVSDFEDSFQNKLTLCTSKNIKNPDLTTISPQTVANLIQDSPSSHYLIVDCRFSFEYLGGKIKGAINILSLEMLEKVFFTYKSLLYNPKYVEDLKKDLVGTLEKVDSYQTNDGDDQTPLNRKLPLVIFHCEFSQKRGPRAFRALRNTDRQKNLKTWPRLDFPEIYILEGGYSAFFSEFAEFCEGTYVKMVEKTHRLEYAIAKDNDKKLWGKKYAVEYN